MTVLGRRPLASVLKVVLDVSFHGAILVSAVLALALAGSHFAQDETASEVGLPVTFSIDGSACSIEARDGTDVTAEIVDAVLVLELAWRPRRTGWLVARLNAYLAANTPGNRMVTSFYGELDPVTGGLRYVNAGRNPPLLVSASGTAHLEPTGVVLGALDGAPFAEGTAQVDAGARLLLFTDGISEAANPGDEELGDERLERVLEQHREACPGSCSRRSPTPSRPSARARRRPTT